MPPEQRGTQTHPGGWEEDGKSIWILDLKTGDEKRLTAPENNAEGIASLLTGSGSYFT